MPKDAKFINIPPLPPPKGSRRSSIASNVSISPPPSPKFRAEPELSPAEPPTPVASFIDSSIKFNLPSYIGGVLTVMILQAGGGSSMSLVVFLAIGLYFLVRPQTPVAASPPSPKKPHALPATPLPQRRHEHRSPSPRMMDEDHAFRPYPERQPSPVSIIYSGESIARLD